MFMCTVADLWNQQNQLQGDSQLQPLVPACAICGMDSTGIHFGVDACAACSAFFRRTVVLNKEYACNKDRKCSVVKDGSAGQKCRACRFSKCLRVGMDKKSVQHRRDAIGKYSDAVKRERSPSPFPVPSDEVMAPPVKVLHRGNNMLEELLEKHETLNKRRKLFYARSSLNQFFDADIDLEVVELTSIVECMYQLWRIEPRLAGEYIMSNKFLLPLATEEKVKLFKNFVIVRQAVEEPYLTWKYGGLDKGWWIMPNRTYIDFNRADHYFSNGCMDGINLDLDTAKNLFLPSFCHAMNTVGDLMRRINLTEIEMVALNGLVLFDPCVPSLNEETRHKMYELRGQLLKDLYYYYEGDESNEDPELRIGNLLMIMSAIRVHCIKTSENMHLLRVFELIPKDNLFDELLQPLDDPLPDVSFAAASTTSVTNGDAIAFATIGADGQSIIVPSSSPGCTVWASPKLSPETWPNPPLLPVASPSSGSQKMSTSPLTPLSGHIAGTPSPLAIGQVTIPANQTMATFSLANGLPTTSLVIGQKLVASPAGTITMIPSPASKDVFVVPWNGAKVGLPTWPNGTM